MKSKAIKFTAATLACIMTAGIAAGCGDGEGGGGNGGGKYNNDTDAVVFSTQPVDGVFSPFFATSGTDMSVTGLTQISMLANDENGNVSYGEKEAVVVEDLEIKTTGTADVDQKTEYKFVLKNNVQFSNGSYLSMKDVLFNLYVYLDPVYTGASTIYSTDIVGLKAYRTQSERESEQDAFMEQFRLDANTRINALVDAKNEIMDENPNASFESADFRKKLEEKAKEDQKAFGHVVADYDKALELFRKELESDYSNALDSYADTVFQDKTGKEYRGLLQSDVEMFLYNEGVLTWNRDDKKIDGYPTQSGTAKELLAMSADEAKKWAIDYVFTYNIPDAIDEVIQYWATAGDLFTYITNEALEEHFKTHETTIKSISGIKFANKTEPVTVNNKSYGVPVYEEGSNNTHVIEGNEVLSITINDIDPKAIWNFAFSVAPMYYYSDEAHINAFDYEENFGVEYGSQSFFDGVIGETDKNGLPVGAGPYAVSRDSGGIGKVAGGTADVGRGDFYNGSMIYYERNDNYLMGAPKIKKVRYEVAQQNQMLNMLYSGDMDFVEPNAKTEIFNEVRDKANEGIGNKEIMTSGYGYIGINAGEVPNLKVRRAIMHCVDTKLTAQYYGTHAEVLNRSMTKANWVYDLALRDKTPYYPFIGDPVPENLDVVDPDYAAYIRSHNIHAGDTLTEAQQEDFIRGLVEGEGYSPNAEGVYTDGSDTLKYRFTIVGSEQDHPAWDALWQAGEMLNKWGFKITVKTDPQGLIKLNTGSLAVWAAAWGSTIDPDMYQVYHKDSTATSVLNWGYRQILRNGGEKYDRENDLLDELALLIEQGRKIDDSASDAEKLRRAKVYAEALDLVMELAVELPTYQRNDLFVYNSEKFDESSFFQNPTSFKGLTADIHTVSLNVAQ